MSRGGTAVDVAISVLVCNGVVTPHSMGLGGGFFMTIHLANGTTVSLVARETAPGAATRDMYSQGRSSTLGPASSGVPGELLGYWEAKQRFGNPHIEWKELLHPSIQLCENGITVSPANAKAIRKSETDIRKDPGLSELFVNNRTGKLLEEGDVYKNPTLANTLRRFADHGADELYTGETGSKLVADMKASGGLMTSEDLASYRVSWEDTVEAEIPGTDYILHSCPPPGSGAVLAAILGLAGGYEVTPRDRRGSLTWHRMVEAMKFAYARRTVLGDWGYTTDKGMVEQVKSLVSNLTSSSWWEETRGKISDSQTQGNSSYYGAQYFNIEDHGTAHMSILSPAGDAVAVTSTINRYFGSKFRSPSTGIIMNNEMDDFSFEGIINSFGIRPSENNMVAPGKRPVSSMSPTIVVDRKGRVKAVVGASGGSKITTAVSQVLFRVLYLGEGIKEAVDARRLHHQLLPKELLYETGLTRWMVKGLEKFGHITKEFPLGGSIVQGILVDSESGDITANSDFRKGGEVAG